MDLNAPHSMGTTIIGVTYDGGVVLGADSRTSTGNFFFFWLILVELVFYWLIDAYVIEFGLDRYVCGE